MCIRDSNVPTKKIPYFDFEVPTVLNGVDTGLLDPRDTYADASQWEEKAKDLASRFIKNFKTYEGNEHGKALVSAVPQMCIRDRAYSAISFDTPSQSSYRDL